MQILGKRILIEEIKEEAQSVDGIIMAHSQNTYKKGKVIGYGDIEIKIEDTVLFDHGREVVIDGKVYTLVDESNLIANV